MKRIFFQTIFALCLFAAAALPSRAQSSERIAFQAPFSFTAGEATLPAGAYFLMEDEIGRAFIVSRQNGRGSAILVLGGVGQAPASRHASVTFIQRNGRYYLDSVSLTDGSVLRLANSQSALLAK